MRLDKYEVLIFDLDGLIIDSLDNLSNALLESVKNFSTKQEFNDFKHYDFKNPGFSRFQKIEYFCKNIVKNKETSSKEILDLFDKRSLDARVKSVVSPGIYQLYDEYKSKIWILLSNCDNRQIKQVLKHFQLLDIFNSNIWNTAIKEFTITKYNKKIFSKKNDFYF